MRDMAIYIVPREKVQRVEKEGEDWCLLLECEAFIPAQVVACGIDEVAFLREEWTCEHRCRECPVNRQEGS